MAETKTETKTKPKASGKKLPAAGQTNTKTKVTKAPTKAPAKTKAKAPKKKLGRKGKYEIWLEPDNLEKVKDWRRNGATIEDLSKLMHVAQSSIKDWAARFPDFSAALKESEVYDDQAEQVLHTLGVTGWVTQDVTEELRLNPETGKEELVVVKRVTKQIPPQTAALIFWLKNRRPDKWRERRDIIDQTADEEYTGIAEMPAVLDAVEYAPEGDPNE